MPPTPNSSFSVPSELNFHSTISCGPRSNPATRIEPSPAILTAVAGSGTLFVTWM